MKKRHPSPIICGQKGQKPVWDNLRRIMQEHLGYVVPVERKLTAEEMFNLGFTLAAVRR
jgi:hypothetical protein